MITLVNDPARPDRMKTRSGGTCMSLIGFIAVALGLFAACIDLIFPDSGATPTEKMIASAFLLLVGSLFLFLRGRTVLDRRKGLILDETSFGFITLRSKSTPMDSFREVEIRKEVRRSDKRNYVVYPVGLKGEMTRDFGSSQTYEESRRSAETLAKFVQLPLIDYSSGEAVRREFDLLDEPLADKLRRLGGTVDVPEDPGANGLSVNGSSSDLRIEIPKGGNNIIAVVTLVMAPMILGSMIVPIGFSLMRDGKGIPPIFLGLIAVFMLIPVCAVLAVAWKTMPAAQSFILNQRTCLLIEKRPIFSKETELKTSEIEELVNMKNPIGAANPMAVLIPNRGLVLRTDNCSVEFAKGLTEEAKGYIESHIKQYLIENC